jgi:hypothetical protein
MIFLPLFNALGWRSHEALVAAAQQLAAIAGETAGSNRAVASYAADAAARCRVEQGHDPMISWKE